MKTRPTDSGSLAEPEMVISSPVRIKGADMGRCSSGCCSSTVASPTRVLEACALGCFIRHGPSYRAVHAGVVTRGLPGVAGRITPEQVRAAVRPLVIHSPRTRVVWVENTHNASGGRVWPLAELDALRELCDELDLRLHLDGARLLNAAVASGEAAATIGSRFDTVTLCLSKGLGCPLGALLAGRAETVARGRRLKHLFGGAMRQAGIVAAAGTYALEHHVERLADDHRRARRLAVGLADAGLAVDPDRVETNFVQVDVAPLGSAEAIALLAEHGVGLSGTIHPGVLRAVTHLDVDDDDIERAVELVPRALAARVEA